MHRYVFDFGQGVSKQDIEHVIVAGRRVARSEDVCAEERPLIKEAVEATKPSDNACFANALKMWEYDNRFLYAEGFAVMDDLDLAAIEHAWCMLDGEKLVDVTEAFDHYHGAIVSDPAVLERHTGSGLTPSGIIGNHHDRFEFLRRRGYLD